MDEENGSCENFANGEQLHEVMELKMIEVNKAYIKILKDTLKMIEEMENKPELDRLRYANMINHLIGIMMRSTQGWQKWCNLNTMDTILSLDELKDLVPKMKALVIQWIEMDIAITEKKTFDAEKEHQSKRTKKSKTKAYVS